MTKTSTPPSDQLLQYLSSYDLKVGELALALRSMILSEVPGALEILNRTYAVSMTYSFTSKWTEGFCMVVVYPHHVNLGFHRGAEFDDADGVLEGTGKIMRHIKVRTLEDLKKPYLRRFIRAAVSNAKVIGKVKEAERQRKSMAKKGPKSPAAPSAKKPRPK
jgi:hypothetical protein